MLHAVTTDFGASPQPESVSWCADPFCAVLLVAPMEV